VTPGHVGTLPGRFGLTSRSINHQLSTINLPELKAASASLLPSAQRRSQFNALPKSPRGIEQEQVKEQD
jgi:hypothetical protein